MIDELIADKKISNIILDRSLPEFIKSDYPMFEAFLAAYYEWLETSKQPIDIIQRLREYRDIDRTISDFIDYFTKEFMVAIPTNILADKQLLLKQIKNFYQNKGNEDSFKFLFRILYNEDIEIYYPKVDILRSSDGKWIQSTTIKIEQGTLELNDLVFLFEGSLIGAISGARANVQNITRYINRNNIPILELDLVNIRGIFEAEEELIVDPDDSNHDIIILKQIYSGINIINQGTKYSVGDPIEIYNTDSNDTIKIGEASVKKIGRGSIISIGTQDGPVWRPEVAGTGYNGLLRDISLFRYLPLNAPYSDSNIVGPLLLDVLISEIASIQIDSSISAISVVDIPDLITIIDTPDPIGFGANGYVSHVAQDGAILEIVLENTGKDYSVPEVQIDSETGSGAEISVLGGGGAILSTEMSHFLTVESNDNITLDFSLGSGQGATGNLIENGAMITYPGVYTNSDGHLSSTPKLQDNYYYQDFSYVILSSISYEKWKDIIGKIIHPAGLKSFGKMALKTIVDNDQILINEDLININIVYL